MKRFPLPIRPHDNLKPKITQLYGDESKNAWYKRNNIDKPFHDGIDITLGSSYQTYGAEIVSPGDDWKMFNIFTDTFLLESPQFAEESIIKKIRLGFGHCSVIYPTRDIDECELIARIGNSGIVKPRPSIFNPFAGTHLHLSCYEYHYINDQWVLQNADNGVRGAIDPLLRIDPNRYCTNGTQVRPSFLNKLFNT